MWSEMLPSGKLMLKEMRPSLMLILWKLLEKAWEEAAFAFLNFPP